MTYGAGKELTTFGFWKKEFDLCLSYGDYDHAFFKQLTQSVIVGNPKFDDWFLEKFFYSLTPSSVRSLVDPHAFAALFRLLLQGLREYRQKEGTLLKRFSGDYNAYCVIVSENVYLREQIEKQLQNMMVSSKEFVFAYITSYGLQCFGSICCAKTEVILQNLANNTCF